MPPMKSTWNSDACAYAKKLENAECSLLLTLLNCNAVYVIQCQISNSPYLFSIQFLETGLGEFGAISSEILQVFFVLNILPVC